MDDVMIKQMRIVKSSVHYTTPPSVLRHVLTEILREVDMSTGASGSTWLNG